MHQYYNASTDIDKLRRFMGRFRSKKGIRALVAFKDKRGVAQWRSTVSVSVDPYNAELLLHEISSMLSKYGTALGKPSKVRYDVWGAL
jgi:hypothetical protein